LFFHTKKVFIFSIVLLTYINRAFSGKIVQLYFTSAKLIALFALIILGLYVGLKTDILSDNFAKYGRSKTVVNPDGTVTVTKLVGTALLGAACYSL
jgi:APA family basic amino acid/polyamine antiporter